MTGEIYEVLFEGHAAGSYKLPSEIVELHQALERLRDAESDLWAPGIREEAETSLVDEMLAAASAGKAIPDASSVIAQRQIAAAAEAYHDALTEAIRQAEHRFRFSLSDSLQTVLVDFLRPALAETIEKATAAVKPLEGIVLDRQSMAEAPEPMRKAWTKLEALAARYSAIRMAREALRLPAPQRDDLNHFSEFRNAGELWPERAAAYSDRSRASIHRTVPELREIASAKPVAIAGPPWPSTQPELLIWIVTHDCAPWLPLALEQDAALEADRKRASALLYRDRSEWHARNIQVAPNASY